jgi:hypothetical protein
MTAFEELHKEEFDIGDIVYVIDMEWRKWEGDFKFYYRKAKIFEIEIAGNVCGDFPTELLYHVDYNYDYKEDENDIDMEWKCSDELVAASRPIMIGGVFNIRQELVRKSMIMLDLHKKNNLKKDCSGDCSDCKERKEEVVLAD